MKKASRIISLFIITVMMLSLTACMEKQTDFLKNGWDGGKDPTTAEEETTLEEISEESTTETENTTNKASGTPNKGSTSAKKPSSSSQTQSSNSQSSSSGNKVTTTKAASSPAQKTYTTTEAIELYKAAANPIKTKSGVTCTRTKEVYTEIGQSNLSGISGTIINTAFAPKTDTEPMTVTGSEITEKFVVEKQSYVCNLTASDVKSATVKTSGNNKIVTIYVKDDTSGQNYSNKAVSATAVYELTAKFSSGISMSCKDVRVTATIDANGRLINLNTYMPAYFTKGDEGFGAAIEQWWTISYA